MLKQAQKTQKSTPKSLNKTAVRISDPSPVFI